MPRSSIKKTGDIEEKKTVVTNKKVKGVKSSKTAKTEKTSSSIKTKSKKGTLESTKKVATKKAVAKKGTASKTPSTKKTTTKKASLVKEVTAPKTATEKKTSTKKSTATKKATTKKSTVAKKSTTKKVTTKKATTQKPKVTSKKSTAVKKSTTKKSTTTKKTATKRKVATNKTKKESTSKNFLDIVEYYDLPYRYNQTVVKVLAQNPNTLFVYWDVSDIEVEKLKKQFGDNFLYVTKPVLVIHNLTNNYSFEIDINDFANNWYVNVSDTRCKYIVELGRRPIQSKEITNIQENTPTQFVKILSSNEIEIPNDRVLFYKDNQKIHFKNVKTNVIVERTYNKKHAKSLSEIYKYFDLEDDTFNNKFDFANPSSNNPTSSFM